MLNAVLRTFSLYLLLTLISCQSEIPKVSFMVFGDPAEFAAYRALVDAFAAQHPAISVQLEHIPSQAEYRQKLATRLTADSPPDVMLLNYRRFAAFAAAGALEPLDAYLATSELIATADFFPIAIDSFRLNGRLWCIPQNLSSLVVYYNQDLFDAAGVAYPSDDWTRADFLAAARQLTQDQDGDGVTDQYGVGLEPNIFRLAPFFWQDNAEIVDDPEQPTRLTLDQPTFRWFVDLQVVEGVVPSAAAEAAESSESRFLNGRLGMLFNSRRGVPTYRTIQGFAWDVVPLPRGERAAGILHSDGYCMAAKAREKTAVWTFIEFANSVEGQTIVAASGRTVPSLRAVAESDAFLDPTLPPKNGRIFIDTLPLLRTVPIMAQWTAIEKTASREIERAFYGQVAVTEAAKTADLLTQPFFQKQETTP